MAHRPSWLTGLSFEAGAVFAGLGLPDGFALLAWATGFALFLFVPMFMIDLQQKDLRIALASAKEKVIPLPGTALVSQLLTANQAAGEGREGTQALVKTLERLAQSG